MSDEEIVRPDGPKIKELRESRKDSKGRTLSQKNMGQRAGGISQSLVSKMENSKEVQMVSLKLYLGRAFGITDLSKIYELTVDRDVSAVNQQEIQSRGFTEELPVIFSEVANEKDDQSFLELWEELNKIAMTRLKNFGTGSIRATALVSPEGKALLMRYAPVLDGEVLVTRTTIEYITILKSVHDWVQDAQDYEADQPSLVTNSMYDVGSISEKEKRLEDLEKELRTAYPSIVFGEVTPSSLPLMRSDSEKESAASEPQIENPPLDHNTDADTSNPKIAERLEPAQSKVPSIDRTSDFPSFRRSLPTLAASLLAAASISWSLWLSSQNASLTARIERQTEISRKAISLTKESLGRTVADSSPLYLSGSTTPTLVRQALLAAMDSNRSGTLSEDDKANLKRGQMLFEEAISLQEPEDRTGRIIVEEATAAIWSADLDRARELLQSSALSPDDPAVINLKGVLAMYESEYQEDARSDLQKDAEILFREAARKGELIAWINLASLMQQLGRTEEAVSALNMYIENASADETSVVREFLPDTTKLPE